MNVLMTHVYYIVNREADEDDEGEGLWHAYTPTSYENDSHDWTNDKWYRDDGEYANDVVPSGDDQH